MNQKERFLNFSLGAELEIAGSFAYHALAILNSSHGIYHHDQVFLFLYNAAVSVERLQKCVLYLYTSEDDLGSFAKTIENHDYQSLHGRIVTYSGEKLSRQQNAMIKLLQEFYKEGRYSKLTPNALYDCRKEFEDFVRKQYGEEMLEKHWFTGEYYISNRAKEYIGRTLGKLLSHYYELIAKRAMELRLYTYELRSDSPAFKVFLNQSPKRSLQSIADRENRALAELIVFLSNSRERTGFLDFLHSIEPLELDPALVQDYLVDIMNKQVPQQLVDEVSTIYEDMSPECVRNRTEVLSLVGNKNVIFHDDEEDNVNSDDEEDGAIM